MQSSYQIVSTNETEGVLKEFFISQNENGVDTENRIEKMKSIFETIKNNE